MFDSSGKIKRYLCLYNRDFKITFENLIFFSKKIFSSVRKSSLSRSQKSESEVSKLNPRFLKTFLKVQKWTLNRGLSFETLDFDRKKLKKKSNSQKLF